MSDQKESSVLFSLKELMNIEEDRLKSEQSALESQARAEREAKEAAERAAREAEERRIREEEERRRSEEMRRREEQARLEAIQHGEVERARAEAEARARMEAMAAQQRHEQQLATIQTASGNKKLKVTVGIVAALFVLGSIGGGLVIKANNEEAARKEAALAADNARLGEEKRELQEAVSKAEDKERALNQQLESAQSDAEKEVIRRQIEDAKAATKAARDQAGGGGARPARPTPAAPVKPKCPPGDPLCTDI